MLTWVTKKAVRLQVPEPSSLLLAREQLSQPPCRELLQGALERFPELEPDRARVLVTNTVERLFFDVMDVGASEAHHHAFPWGLARHSLEVALQALRVARTRYFVGHAAPNPEEQEHRLPRLRYAGFLFALYHDAGKLAQVKVEGPRRQIFNPFLEGLGAFFDRHGREGCRVSWRSGRALEDHLRLTPYLIGRWLSIESAAYVGSELLAELWEGKSTAATEIQGLISDADQWSVENDRRRAAKDLQNSPEAGESVAAPRPSFGSLVATAFRGAQSAGAIGSPGVDSDFFFGREYVLLRYPEGVLELINHLKKLTQEPTVREVEENDAGARLFVGKLARDEGVFVDPTGGLWKLNATIRSGSESRVLDAVLLSRKILGVRPNEAPLFEGSVTFRRSSDDTVVVVPGFEEAIKQTAEATTRRAPQIGPPVVARPIPATLGPKSGIDPEELVRDLLRGITEGWIPTNIFPGLVYISPRKTFVATPAVFLKMREKGLYPDYDPQDRTSSFLNALVPLDFVHKSPNRRIVFPVLLGPESDRPLKVIKFDTPGLFTSKAVIERVGLWKDWQRIVELPQTWKPGDAISAGDDSEEDSADV